ncbi:shikimate dehydrogenase family protein [Aequorivita marisscotiae]|uniref:Shikimate dehydrogenase n=1 Tax=Aequorivita marisscotiae TaxID=3040348 RepID=A0ABY8KYD4_9FLAO|nr:shikimate dehydrogenase [Aequorivita sp. Ant34-E75]WGF94142.1 shikimate dehydrogenase [Aequorivita sp. Ant34-E75]
MAKFGLLGRNIDYSFSRTYFSKKFEREDLPHIYLNFDIKTIELFPKVLQKNQSLKGLNVTIPYKQAILPYLNALHIEAEKIGAVNTVKISSDKRLTGYNTDYFGFQKALESYLPLRQKTALILGTGGASKAVAYALEKLGFTYKFVSRKQGTNRLTYAEIDRSTIENHSLVVNCTPLGTFPNVSECPAIPYQFLTKEHLLFDLIYNPAETEFLKRGKQHGAKCSNGLKMLELQAEKAWEIWNS